MRTNDGDVTSNAPGSKGARSVRRHVNCSRTADVISRPAHAVVAPKRSFSTPRAMTSWKNCNGGADSQVNGYVDNDITPPKCNITKHIARHALLLLPVSPPAMASCPSDTSSQTGAKSRIDTNGFLISPNASFDREWGGVAGGSDGTFDPNSFLFLSPLSNHDFDDPDHGMPELLSKSNSRNAVVLDNAGGTGLGPPKDATSTVSIITSVSPSVAVSKRLSRLAPSPRMLPTTPRKLSPSAKTMLKKIKVIGRRNDIGANKTSPILSRSITSTF